MQISSDKGVFKRSPLTSSLPLSSIDLFTHPLTLLCATSIFIMVCLSTAPALLFALQALIIPVFAITSGQDSHDIVARQSGCNDNEFYHRW
ncbi:hypothetical protein BDV37DRAFT_258187 [Aspergillus pseudonomiae]|uniref:Uncharacterized protein n=1 Tax=Aspergillus pseudonomiae TaxID=1506151 RepID=A0A5N7D1J7_9EURO|nr:uncharacterized protein BDV37DRAFT_258187 [Aspergillus pseudonomiae]KAE8400286.1 hypothetical protein BDV37DRAFT_258187 [Aspergillus pseudonomiae]